MKLFYALQNLIDPSSLPKGKTTSTADYLRVAFIVMGSIALLMLVIAGLRYVLSAGNPDKMAESKKMIIYTVVGMIAATLAASIISIIIGRLQ